MREAAITEPVHIRVAMFWSGTWRIQTMYLPMGCGLEFPDRRSATAVARSLSLALRENKVSQAPVLTLARADAMWLMDLVQEETENTECMLLEEKRSVDRAIRLVYEWLIELDALIPAEDGSLGLDFGQACVVVDLLHEYIDTEEEDPEAIAPAQLMLLCLRDAGVDISVYYTENSPHPGYRYELCGDAGNVWYNAYDPKGNLVVATTARSEIWAAVHRHHGPPVGGTQIRIED